MMERLKIKRSRLPNKKTAIKRHVKGFHMRSSATVFEQLAALVLVQEAVVTNPAVDTSNISQSYGCSYKLFYGFMLGCQGNL